MQRSILAALGFALLTVTAAAQAPDIGRMLQGLTTGNQDQDRALRDAYERGYQRGRDDEARRSDRDRDRSGSRNDYRPSDRDYDRPPPNRQ